MKTGWVVEGPNMASKNLAPMCGGSAMTTSLGVIVPKTLDLAGQRLPGLRLAIQPFAGETCFDVSLSLREPRAELGRRHFPLPQDFSGGLTAIGDAIDDAIDDRHGRSSRLEARQALILFVLRRLGAFDRRLILGRNPSVHVEDRNVD